MAEEEKFAVEPSGMKGERREATSLAIWRVDAMVAGEGRRGEKSRWWGGGRLGQVGEEGGGVALRFVGVAGLGLGHSFLPVADWRAAGFCVGAALPTTLLPFPISSILLIPPLPRQPPPPPFFFFLLSSLFY